ncbi:MULTISPECIES: hypothetical protein [unclassified Endozoicomonas]|uniref:hypothetical protein n=1 Tax=unclassified Endozoicomonas TaxID=2644528 RepID=UPI003BB76617
MNSRYVKASGSGSKIEAIAQFLLAKAIGQTASASASFNRQVIAQDKPYDPGIKRKPGEEKLIHFHVSLGVAIGDISRSKI